MAEVDATVNLSKLLQEEKNLAKRLRTICDASGKEDESKLGESTEVLELMGRLYVKKAELTEGMDQKLNFVKAAALLHGARVRSEMFLKGHGMPQIRDALNEMQTLLMRKRSTNANIDLAKISIAFKNVFEELRAKERKKLDALEMIDENMPKKKLMEVKSRRGARVGVLMLQNTDDYIAQMQNIAEKCLNILGSQPCDFAVVCLGSLARQEVTLYSDFEHVIILEEGIQERDDYREVLEYFRWFSVIFHIIVIGIGETIIPSVGVESLNDLYSKDKSRNWFYDSFTPSGVSFDGMMPHACKIPMGRQKSTLKKDFIVELIKPVSEMVLYLTSQQDIKNGYCLKDVMCETGFVFGSSTVFSQFDEEAHGILPFEYRRGFSSDGTPSADGRYHASPWDAEADDTVFRQAPFIKDAISDSTSHNTNPYVSGRLSFTQEDIAFDPKTAFYRPISVLLTYLSRFLRTNGKTGISKIMFLNPAIIDDAKGRFLHWALGTACEIRLKSYAENHGNRVGIPRNDAVRYVGESRCSNCESVVDGLSKYLITLPQNDKLQCDFLDTMMKTFERSSIPTESKNQL